MSTAARPLGQYIEKLETEAKEHTKQIGELESTVWSLATHGNDMDWLTHWQYDIVTRILNR